MISAHAEVKSVPCGALPNVETHLPDSAKPELLDDCYDPRHETSQMSIVLDNVCLCYGNIEALHGLTISFQRGSITGIIGPNGSGKSSLLKILARLLKPTSGVICWHNTGRIAMLHQVVGQDNFMPLRVKDVLKMGRYRASKPLRMLSSEDKSIIQQAAERTGITGLMRRQITELSVGQQRKVRLAMWICSQSEVLLLDEPESGMDLSSRYKTFDIMKEEKSRGTTVIYTTHSLSEINVCDNVLMLNRQMIAQGSPDDVVNKKNVGELYGLPFSGDDIGGYNVR